MDANAIAMDLQHRGVISDGDLQAIKQEIGTSRQNRLLHARLKKTCTVEALMDACDIITMVEGNPKLKSLGQDMKTELEKGLSCVGECHQEYIRIWVCNHIFQAYTAFLSLMYSWCHLYLVYVCALCVNVIRYARMC